MHNLSPLATTKSLDAVVTVGDTFDDSARSSPSLPWNVAILNQLAGMGFRGLFYPCVVRG